nr:MalY/PatB family protein [Xylanivirga thermophila]
MDMDFDKVVNRRGTYAIKWDYNKEFFGREDVLPMWVADMDFLSPKPVIDALKNRVGHGVFGYTERPESYYKAIIDWEEKRHGLKIQPEWILNSPGVVTSLAFAVDSCTDPGDRVLIQTPVYPPFYNVVKNNGRELVTNPLKMVEGHYEMDFDDLEEKFRSGVKMMILCSPHNPVGRVWTYEELKTLVDMCSRYDVFLVCDEIHSDIVYKGYRHTSVLSISDWAAQNTITCIAPSKTFNIAGLTTSVAIIPNEVARKKFKAGMDRFHIENNLLGITALEAAYRYGGEWLDELIMYLGDNLRLLSDCIDSEVPGVKLVVPEGTYLAWLDFRALGMDDDELKSFIIHKAGLGLNDGPSFGIDGSGFQRLNFACPRSILEEGLSRLSKAIKCL